MLVLALAGCASAIRDGDKSVASALQKRDDTSLGRRIAPALAAHPGQTGMRLVSSNLDAFALRVLGARKAQRSLDLQYYIWHNDLTGKMLAGELVRAADRGVKVRLLVDDMDVRSKEAALQTMDAHENIEVRLFNPFKSASGAMRTMVEFLFRGSALNHRMHNKAFIADGQFALVGGRNVGDEYFGASGETNFSDMDLAMIGPAVVATSAAFDMYWNHPTAVRVEYLKRGEPMSGGLDALRGAIDAHVRKRRRKAPTSSACGIRPSWRRSSTAATRRSGAATSRCCPTRRTRPTARPRTIRTRCWPSWPSAFAPRRPACASCRRISFPARRAASCWSTPLRAGPGWMWSPIRWPPPMSRLSTAVTRVTASACSRAAWRCTS
ncbi:MAG: hypothetical protein IPO66_17895 [Rhodanobacteraceae bacterium]|nr:hypothetical protein [Rhodanobacteraceae bacterium]